ncbi:MFS transporter [Mycobacterium genavense]|uniref:MFS transporter n=1 Tax=Mycobacterium genavense TaxID=36812 RepID=UPI0004AF99F9|nr:MFS transporter [Mycobacterium genavense]
MDSFIYAAGAHAGAARTVAAVGHVRDAGQRRCRGIDPVRPVPGGLGAFLYLGPDRRPVRADEGAGRDDLHIRDVWELATFRFIAGVGIGGEWALAGTYVAEAWPEDRRKMGAGYLQTGYYAGFFLAAALNYAIGVHFGWRAMFLTGAVPIVVAILFLTRVKETDRWQRADSGGSVRVNPLRESWACGTGAEPGWPARC